MAQDKGKKVTPRDVANMAETAIVSLPQSVLSLLLCISLDRQQDVKSCSADKALHSKEIDGAIEYLTRTFAPAFKTASGEFDDELAAATEGLNSILSRVRSDLPQEEEEPDTKALLELKMRVEADLTPAVSTFLSALFDRVVLFEKASAKLAKDVDSSALTQIDEIARQINFIAINASVEAARVGDAGRGFAVIASEIKQLSDRSRDAVERVRSSAI